jgi:hypothetical protein
MVSNGLTGYLLCYIISLRSRLIWHRRRAPTLRRACSRRTTRLWGRRHAPRLRFGRIILRKTFLLAFLEVIIQPASTRRTDDVVRPPLFAGRRVALGRGWRATRQCHVSWYEEFRGRALDARCR